MSILARFPDAMRSPLVGLLLALLPAADGLAASGRLSSVRGAPPVLCRAPCARACASASASPGAGDGTDGDESLLKQAGSAASAVYAFSRPHTVRGTLLACATGVGKALIESPEQLALLPALLPRSMLGVLALVLGNLFIVGINQIYDVEIDLVNKPFLPIAAGVMSPAFAWAVVVASGAYGGATEAQVTVVVLRWSWLCGSPWLLHPSPYPWAVGSYSLERRAQMSISRHPGRVHRLLSQAAFTGCVHRPRSQAAHEEARTTGVHVSGTEYSLFSIHGRSTGLNIIPPRLSTYPQTRAVDTLIAPPTAPAAPRTFGLPAHLVRCRRGDLDPPPTSSPMPPAPRTFELPAHLVRCCRGDIHPPPTSSRMPPAPFLSQQLWAAFP